MTREEFIAEMRKKGWSIEEIQGFLTDRDELSIKFGRTDPYELYLIDNPAQHMRSYQIRDDGHWEDVEQEA